MRVNSVFVSVILAYPTLLAYEKALKTPSFISFQADKSVLVISLLQILTGALRKRKELPPLLIEP